MRSLAERSPRRNFAWILQLFFIGRPATAAAPHWSDESANLMAEADQLQAASSWGEALQLYDEALRRSPNPPLFQAYVVHNNIGWSLFHLGQHDAAEEQYKKALATHPDKPPTDHAYINLATLYKAEHRLKPTIKAYRAAISLTHQLPTWAQLGNALMMDFRVDEAVHVLQEGLAYHGDAVAAADKPNLTIATHARQFIASP